MEEDIKILEDFFEDRMLVEKEKRALENLIHSVKYNVVPKYKIRKKIEEYQANMKLYEQHLSNIFHENDIRQEVITVLTDLLREENNESKF